MFEFFDDTVIAILSKAIALLFLFLYLLFSFIMYTHARRLGDVLTITHSHISRILNGLFLLHLLLALSLFFIALAIL